MEVLVWDPVFGGEILFLHIASMEPWQEAVIRTYITINVE